MLWPKRRPKEADEAVTPGKARVEAFSDGVIAILITIMVLDLKLPDALAQGFDRAAIEAFAPRLIAYAMSFLVLAIMWVNHHYLLATLRQARSGFLWMNNILLFSMSLIPAATANLGAHPFSATAAAIYGGVLTASAAMFTAMRDYLRKREQDNEALARLHRAVTAKSLVGTAIYAASVPLAFVSVYLAFACFAVVPAMFFLPDSRPRVGG